jgi:hypothetical protein
MIAEISVIRGGFRTRLVPSFVSRHPTTGRYALVFLLFVAITCVFFIHIVVDMGGRILWNLSDASNGIRLYWATAHAGTDPYHFQRDLLNGAPEGLPVPSAPNVAAPFQAAVIWALMPLMSIQTAFNLYLLGGFVLTGFAAFVLLDRLGLHPFASFFAAYVITFNPWMIYKARDGQPGFTQGWALILIVGAGLWLIRSRTPRSAVCLGLALGVTFWIATYWGLLGSVIAGMALLVDAVRARPPAEKLWTCTLATIAICITGVFLLPGGVAYLTHRATVNRALDNPNSELQNCAARAGSYLLPASGHPVCGELAQDLSAVRRGGQNEQTVFFGYTTYVLALATLLFAMRRKVALDPRQRQAVLYLGCLAPVAVYFSLPRVIHLGGLGIPAPSFFISHATNFFRCYARFGYVFGIAVAFIAAIGLNILLTRHRRRGAAVSIAALVVVAFELLYGPINAWTSDKPPAYVTWLAKQPQGIVASYPAPTDQLASLVLAQREYWYQVYDAKPLYTIFGSGWGGTREEGIRILSRYVDNPLTPAILAAEKVHYVVVHDDVYRQIDETPPKLDPTAYEHVATFPHVRIYVLRKSVAPADLNQTLEQNAAEVALVQGLHAPTTVYRGFGPSRSGWRAVQPDAELLFGNRDVRLTRIQVIAHVRSPGGNSLVQLEDATGAVVASASVGTQDTQVTFGPFALPQGTSRWLLRFAPQQRPSALLGSVNVQPLANYSDSIAASS